MPAKRLFRWAKLVFGVEDERAPKRPESPPSTKKEEEGDAIKPSPRPIRNPVPAPRGNSLRAKLQRELDKGVALEQRVRNPLEALGASVLLGARTTQTDVDAWEARVERLLRDHPRWLALFRYREPPGPFDHLVRNPFESPLRERLAQGNAGLEKIIRSLP